MNSSSWIDISLSIHNGMVVWPTDPPVEISSVSRISEGDLSNASRVSMGSHTGTHIDAPLHFINNGAGIDKMPYDATVGRARVIFINDTESIKLEELKEKNIKSGERILFKTINSKQYLFENKFVEKYVYLSTEGAAYLAGKNVKCLGIDYFSIGSFENGEETHKILLKKGIWVIEGVNLRNIEEGDYYLNCLPIRMHNADGAPARALLKKEK